MNPLVVRFGREFFERSSTGSANMGLLVAVVQQVLVVGLLERERFAADLASVGHLSCKESGNYSNRRLGYQTINYLYAAACAS